MFSSIEYFKTFALPLLGNFLAMPILEFIDTSEFLQEN